MESKNADRVLTLPPDQLTPNDYNPNRMKGEKFAELVLLLGAVLLKKPGSAWLTAVKEGGA